MKKVHITCPLSMHPSILSLETNGWTRLEGGMKELKIYFFLSPNHTGVNTPIRKNGSPFISVKLACVVSRLLIQNSTKNIHAATQGKITYVYDLGETWNNPAGSDCMISYL